MSSIGRIFVILNLILAAAFLGWASTSLARGSEWKQKFEDEKSAHDATRAQLEQEKSALQTDLNTVTGVKEGFRTAKETLEREQGDLTRDLEEARKTNDQLRADVSGINATLAGYNQTIANLEKAKDAAVTEARDMERQRNAAQAERDKALLAQRGAEEALKTAQNSVADLERQLTSSKKDVAKLDAELQVAKSQGFEPGLGSKPIEARVLQVNNDLQPGLVALNVGADQGVSRGMTFQIYSGETWKGQVRVEKVEPGMCSALIMTLRPGQSIVQGDSAATIL